jgi:D-alanine-D-alanine ligase
MKRLRVLVLMHADLVPPDHLDGQDAKAMDWRTEYDVVTTLRKRQG